MNFWYDFKELRDNRIKYLIHKWYVNKQTPWANEWEEQSDSQIAPMSNPMPHIVRRKEANEALFIWYLM